MHSLPRSFSSYLLNEEQKKFISHLRDRNLITIHETANEPIQPMIDLSKTFVETMSNNKFKEIYLWDELKKYIEEASYEEIKAARMSLISIDNKPIKLEQIKSDLNLCNTILFNKTSIELFNIQLLFLKQEEIKEGLREEIGRIEKEELRRISVPDKDRQFLITLNQYIQQEFFFIAQTHKYLPSIIAFFGKHNLIKHYSSVDYLCDLSRSLTVCAHMCCYYNK